MKPVFQTRFHIPGEQNGNCYSACIASLFEVCIDDVPTFVDYQGPLACWDAVRAWCRDRGFDIGVINKLSDVQYWADRPPGNHAIATVQSPRGDWLHCVIVDPSGVVVHDPYPDSPIGHKLDELIDFELIVAPYDPFPTQPADL